MRLVEIIRKEQLSETRSGFDDPVTSATTSRIKEVKTPTKSPKLTTPASVLLKICLRDILQHHALRIEKRAVKRNGVAHDVKERLAEIEQWNDHLL